MLTMLLLLCFTAVAPDTRPASDAIHHGNPPLVVPEGAEILLEFDRKEYFLGENVLLHFTLVNKGTQPFQFNWGGDSRSIRPLRFKITARDEAGRIAEDPHPSPPSHGGPGGTSTLRPGESFVRSLALMRYCRFDHPGQYTIEATHDFGWKEEARQRPVGTTTITFRMPDADQAEQVIKQMEALPTDPNAFLGKRSRDHSDFSCLCYSVYLDPLVRRVGQGDLRGLAGLECMPTTQATRALIELADQGPASVRPQAARAIIRRLPVPKTADSLPGGWFHVLQDRKRFSAKAWDDQLVLPARMLAVKLLKASDAPQIGPGASIIEAVGTAEDAPAVLDALDPVIQRFFNPRHGPKDNILDLPAPIPELVRAMQALRSRGFSLGESVGGVGQIFLYFQILAGQPPPRPANWQQMLEAFGRSGPFPIREAALRSIPQPAPDACVQLIEQGLRDPDGGVGRAACSVAGKSGNKQFLTLLLELIATGHHEWLLREASDAARSLGAGFELLEVWAERLNEENLFQLALDNLQTVFEGLPGGWSGRTDLTATERLELRKQWKEFLAAHADQLRQGSRLKLTDPAAKPALFGRARQWHLPDGTTWPKSE